MQFDTVANVTGIKRFKDTVEGKAYDSTTVFAEVAMDEKSGNAKGVASQPFGWGTSENFSRIAHLPFPFQAKLTFEMVTNGKGSGKQVLIDLKPLQPAPKA
ncbi:hypothetical protein [Zoogloea sp.]|uniref:hypothetical protein n=1 Tax=Zoogloea sp. TaxID=49181 RepID=UPI001AD22F69|nr:hypothetical protein [Zoogloea sp.]MBN8281935.1 hypothetical protein [Zoogloea sp.]